MTGDILYENFNYPSNPRDHLYCKLWDDPDRVLLKRRLNPDFETVNHEEYNQYRKEENYSSKNLSGGIEEIWEEGDTAFRYYEFFSNREPVNFILYKEFYSNGNIKEKGIRPLYQDCFTKTGLWYYFDLKGILINIIDEDGRELCLLTEQEIIAYCKKHFGYREGIEDEYRVRMAGLPHIQIRKNADYYKRISDWTINWYSFEPDLVRITLNLEGKNEKLVIKDYTKIKIDLIKELQRLKEEKEGCN